MLEYQGFFVRSFDAVNLLSSIFGWLAKDWDVSARPGSIIQNVTAIRFVLFVK
jgi:hypothetical protein